MAIMLSVDAKWKDIMGDTTSNEQWRCIFLKYEVNKQKRMEDRWKFSLGIEVKMCCATGLLKVIVSLLFYCVISF
jgi:hypothetical protein